MHATASARRHMWQQQHQHRQQQQRLHHQQQQQQQQIRAHPPPRPPPPPGPPHACAARPPGAAASRVRCRAGKPCGLVGDARCSLVGMQEAVWLPLDAVCRAQQRLTPAGACGAAVSHARSCTIPLPAAPGLEAGHRDAGPLGHNLRNVLLRHLAVQHAVGLQTGPGAWAQHRCVGRESGEAAPQGTCMQSQQAGPGRKDGSFAQARIPIITCSACSSSASASFSCFCSSSSVPYLSSAARFRS